VGNKNLSWAAFFCRFKERTADFRRFLPPEGASRVPGLFCSPHACKTLSHVLKRTNTLPATPRSELGPARVREHSAAGAQASQRGNGHFNTDKACRRRGTPTSLSSLSCPSDLFYIISLSFPTCLSGPQSLLSLTTAPALSLSETHATLAPASPTPRQVT
jgi:hypothetical protein